MTNGQPTPADLRDFWEHYGLHYNKPSGGFFWDKDDNLVFDMHKGETGISLRNLFDYAVPELGLLYRISFVTCEPRPLPDGSRSYPVRCTIHKWNGADIDLDTDVYWVGVAFQWGDTYEDALYRALQQVREGK